MFSEREKFMFPNYVALKIVAASTKKWKNVLNFHTLIKLRGGY